MGIPETTHERAPRTRHHDYGVDSLMYLAHLQADADVLLEAQRDALRRVTEDELSWIEFEPIRSAVRVMQDADVEDERYLFRQAELAAGIVSLDKWDRPTREVLAWIAILDGTLRHGYEFRKYPGCAIRTSSAKMAMDDPHGIFATYTSAPELHRFLERAYVRTR